MQVDKIFHIADLHIRNYQRHTEYNNVFKRLYSYIKKNKTPGSVIYLAGDIVHQKTDLSPELVAMVGKFLKACADICPTIMICGNHDTNLNNSNRLDALTPVVDNLKHRRLYYWKDSGVYKMNQDDNVSFAVFSVFDSIDQWPSADQLPKTDIKIALHHGSVMGATTDMDYLINNTSVTTNNFKGFDYGLLGDIHKMQYLNPAETIAYSSSLIQQNHGESIHNHGLIEWNIIDKTKKFVEIENDIAYATIEFQDNQLVTSDEYIKLFPKYLRLRVKHDNTDLPVIHDYIDTLKHKYTFKEYILRKASSGQNVRMSDLTIGNVRDIEFQNKLITDFLNVSHPGISDDLLDGIRYINRKTNAGLNDLEKNAKNTTWKLISMDFENMFSFGDGNSINFKDMQGIQGIFAPNASGKSSILEILTFCLFDKCSKTFKAEDVLNNTKTSFNVTVTFEINDELYTISRIGTANDLRKVRVNVDFHNSYESLKGKDRDETNKIIRSYIGTYDDFMLTALSTQTDNRNFIFKTQRERKELLYSFLDLKIFTDLHSAAKNILKDKKALITNLSDKLSIIEESEFLSSITSNNDKITKYTSTLMSAGPELLALESELKQCLLNVTPIPNVRDKVIIESELDKAKSELNDLITKTIPELKTNIQKIKEFIELVGDIKIDKNRESELKSLLSDKNSRLKNEQSNLNKLKHALSTMQNQIDVLATHQYDPNCRFCVDNDFVKNATEAKINLPKVQINITNLELIIADYSEEIAELKLILNEFNTLSENVNKKYIAETKLEALQQKVETLKLTYKNLTEKIQQLESEIEMFKLNEDQIIKNAELQKSIDRLETEIDGLKAKIKRNETAINQLKLDSARKSEMLKINNIDKAELKTLTTEYDLYSMYCDATSPLGVPYALLTKILPVIENEINQLLTGLTDFTVELMNDEKSILCYLTYPNGNSWPIELASGMERFMVSVVSRVALIEVTSLARPNFIAIDEGFGVLDANNIPNVVMLFDKIRDKFEFIVCITHLDSLKDVADKTLNITKEGDYSYINV